MCKLDYIRLVNLISCKQSVECIQDIIKKKPPYFGPFENRRSSLQEMTSRKSRRMNTKDIVPTQWLPTFLIPLLEQIRAAQSKPVTHITIHYHVMYWSLKELSNESAIGMCQCLDETVCAESRKIHIQYKFFQNHLSFEAGCSYKLWMDYTTGCYRDWPMKQLLLSVPWNFQTFMLNIAAISQLKLFKTISGEI
jgi:hypothetical protein